MRGRLSDAVVVLVACLVSPAQQPANAPTFRASTNLVEFTVVALDAKGQPVTGLKQDEVSIEENGRPRALALFRFEGAPAETPPSKPLPPGIASNRSEYAPTPMRNVIALVLDTINTSPGEQLAARSQLTRYLKALPPHTRAGVFRLGNEITVLHDLTDDVDAVLAAIAKGDSSGRVEFVQPGVGRLRDGPPSGSSAAAMTAMAEAEARALMSYNRNLRDNRLAMTLAGLEAVGDHLARIPGRKSLVWVTGGMAIRLAGNFDKSYEPAIRRTAQRLASQGIAVYPVDAKGLSSPFARKTAQGQAGQHDSETRIWASLDVMAEVSGGRVIKLSNDPSEGVHAAAADQRGAYLLGFYSDEPDNDWHRLTIKVHRPGVKTLAPQGYLARAPEAEPQDGSPEVWRRIAYHPLGSSAVRLDARSELVSGTLNVLLHIAGEDLRFAADGNQSRAELEIGIAEMGGGIRHERVSIGLSDEQARDAKSAMIRYANRWSLRPETTAVRLIVRDRFTGRYGTLDLRLDQIHRR